MATTGNIHQTRLTVLSAQLGTAGDEHRVHLRGETLYARPNSGRLGNLLTGIKDLFGGQAERRGAINWIRSSLNANFRHLSDNDVQRLLANIRGDTITVAQLRQLSAAANQLDTENARANVVNAQGEAPVERLEPGEQLMRPLPRNVIQGIVVSKIALNPARCQEFSEAAGIGASRSDWLTNNGHAVRARYPVMEHVITEFNSFQAGLTRNQWNAFLRDHEAFFDRAREFAEQYHHNPPEAPKIGRGAELFDFLDQYDQNPPEALQIGRGVEVPADPNARLKDAMEQLQHRKRFGNPYMPKRTNAIEHHNDMAARSSNYMNRVLEPDQKGRSEYTQKAQVQSEKAAWKSMRIHNASIPEASEEAENEPD